MRTGGVLSVQMLTTESLALLKAGHKWHSEFPTSQNKDGSKIICMIGFLSVKRKSVLLQGNWLLQRPHALLKFWQHLLHFPFVVIFITQLIHVCCGENIRKCR